MEPDAGRFSSHRNHPCQHSQMRVLSLTLIFLLSFASSSLVPFLRLLHTYPAMPGQWLHSQLKRAWAAFARYPLFALLLQVIRPEMIRHEAQVPWKNDK